MARKWFQKVKGFTIGWIIAILIWILIKQGGFDTYLYIINARASLPEYLVFMGLVALIAGLIFGSVQFYYERIFAKAISFQFYALRALMIHLLIMVVIYLLFFAGLYVAGISKTLDLQPLFTDPLILVNLLYFFLVNGLIVITFQLEKLLGKGNLTKLITGRFHVPREETRAFMFLDLMSSTTIAEQLGHLKYSKFIQDCFHHLSVIDPFGASIYQYVGDEVVLTWKIKHDDTLENCIHAFYAYSGILKTKGAYYQSEYGVQPVFKAGLHLGPVTVVEVGNLKREIAYHGDTINVASRIQEQCKVFKRNLLCSYEVYGRLKNLSGYTSEKVGEFTLRGKKKPTKLYDINPALARSG